MSDVLNIFGNCHRNLEISAYTKEKNYKFQSHTSFIWSYFKNGEKNKSKLQFKVGLKQDLDPYQDGHDLYQDPDQTKFKDPDLYQRHLDP